MKFLCCPCASGWGLALPEGKPASWLVVAPSFHFCSCHGLATASSRGLSLPSRQDGPSVSHMLPDSEMEWVPCLLIASRAPARPALCWALVTGLHRGDHVPNHVSHQGGVKWASCSPLVLRPCPGACPCPLAVRHHLADLHSHLHCLTCTQQLCSWHELVPIGLCTCRLQAMSVDPVDPLAPCHREDLWPLSLSRLHLRASGSGPGGHRGFMAAMASWSPLAGGPSPHLPGPSHTPVGSSPSPQGPGAHSSDSLTDLL